jgi:hypothetical protein
MEMSAAELHKRHKKSRDTEKRVCPLANKAQPIGALVLIDASWVTPCYQPGGETTATVAAVV